MVVQAARLVPRGKHRTWACPCCGRTLGEVYDDTVTVKAGERLLVFPIDAGVEQHCPKCGTVSTARKEEVA